MVNFTANPAQFINESAPDRVPQLVGSPQEMRDIMAKLKVKATNMVPAITEGLDVKDISIVVSDGASILVRVYTPTSRAATETGQALV